MALRHLVVTYLVYEVFSLNANDWRMHIKCLLNKSTSFPLPHLCFFYFAFFALEIGQLCVENKAKQNQNQNQTNLSAVKHLCMHSLQTNMCHTLCDTQTRTDWSDIEPSHSIAFPKYVRRFVVCRVHSFLCAFVDKCSRLDGWCKPMLKRELEHVFGRLVDENTERKKMCTTCSRIWFVCLRIWYTRACFHFLTNTSTHTAQVVIPNSDNNFDPFQYS